MTLSWKRQRKWSTESLLVIQTESFGDASSKSKNDADEQHILMISQDIIHAVTPGRKKMPKHVGLAMTIRHVTGSKQVINILNCMGHCSSYEDAEVIDTSLAAEVLALKETGGVVNPTNITPGSFIETAMDNNDLLENTLNSKHTTHLTTVVMYQQGQFGPKPQKAARADHTSKGRSLKIAENPQRILEFGAFGKKSHR